MNGERVRGALALAVVTVWLMLLSSAASAHAEYTGPVKEVLSSQIGWEVNKTTKGNNCLVAAEECQPALPSTEAGGFEQAADVAINANHADPAHFGHLYVIDGTHRVQELAANGSFVSMFGWDVNKSKVDKGGASQQEMNICTATEVKAGVVCQAGVEGAAPGQFGEQQSSIAVDSTTGAIYVTDRVTGSVGGHSVYGGRVQKFSAGGEWLWELGKEVNETTKASLCTQEEVEAKGVKCGGPAQYELGAEPPANATEPGVIPILGTTVLAIGGPEDLVYTGAGRRVQEFLAGGSFKSQFSLTDPVRELTLDGSCQLHEPVLTGSTSPTCASFDPSYGDLYALYEQSTVVHKLDPKGEPLAEFSLSARAEHVESFDLRALAIDSSGRLGVSEIEEVREPSNPTVRVSKPFGSLLDAADGHLITEFAVLGLGTLRGLAFSASDKLYGNSASELLSYVPVHVAELLTRSAPCGPGAEADTNATFNCTLNGEANPEAVENTEVWFQWGLTSSFGSETPVQTLCTAACSSTPTPVPPAVLSGLRPNQTVDYRLAAHDQNVTAPELLTSATASFTTPTVAPRILGEPSALFVTSSSADLVAALNPENAPTEYFFEYAPNLGGYCEGALRTATLRSAVYGPIGATLEVTGLQPATTYRYRLCAANQAGKARDAHGGGAITEGAFTTSSAPVPQAVTGPVSGVGTTYATISGAVNPGGQPATYAFELGIYNGEATQFGVVFSGAAGSAASPVGESLDIVGLQPGTAYAYRIRISSGYGTAYGAAATFTTEGLPSLLLTPTPLALLAVPTIAFPGESKTSSVRSPTNAQRLAKALKACNRKPKKKRAACRRQARKKYGHKGTKAAAR
jgi:hypothetical protein